MKKYNIIVADPAWNIQYVKGGKTAGSIKGASDLPYQTMTDKELFDLPVQNLSDDNCLLFCWIVDSKKQLLFELFKHWGFRFVSTAFIWNKITKDTDPANETDPKLRCTLSPYTRKSCEEVYMAVKGSGRDLIVDHTVQQYIGYASENRLHSAKPIELFNRIDKLVCKDAKKLEMFARENRENWDSWGNECKLSINLENYKTSLF